ncbi:helix-turn-helix domain-containing protein [Rhodococcus sp. KBS0724]|uniref:helix-turn-helix domain-containing protein n=1 Tax=Rhodococcus sp. KBS0724 TaxID=1179674 RepID=UPI0021B0D68E|nr:helix-turn-helix domain-containing protein [Rhodococcus sp. KBS0724]
MNDPRIDVSTEFVDAADRDDYWRAATRPFYVTERSSRDAPLHGTMFGSATGTSLIGETTFSSQNYVRNRRLITESELDDHYLVQGWTAGAMSGDADGVDFLVQPHEVSFIDLGKPLRASVRTHPRRTARAISLVVPRSLVEAPSHGRSLHGTVLTGVPAVVFSQCLQSISEALPHLDFAAAAQYEDVVESLLKATVGQVAPERSFRAPPEDLRARALTYILDHLGESWLSPTTICVALAVSRAQLYRAFNDDGGIAQVIRRKRLEHAYRELTTSDSENMSVEEISRRWGFTSKPQFVRAFDAFYGTTPSRVRLEGRRTIGNPSINRLHHHLTTLSAETSLSTETA